MNLGIIIKLTIEGTENHDLKKHTQSLTAAKIYGNATMSLTISSLPDLKLFLIFNYYIINFMMKISVCK